MQLLCILFSAFHDKLVEGCTPAQYLVAVRACDQARYSRIIDDLSDRIQNAWIRRTLGQPARTPTPGMPSIEVF